MNKRIVDRLRADVVSASLTGWRKAVYIVMLYNEGAGSAAIAEAVNVPGFSGTVVQQHLDAMELAVSAGLWDSLDAVTTDKLPEEAFDAFYSGISRDKRYQTIVDRDAIERRAMEQGVGVSKALDIAKNPNALRVAFGSSQRAQEAVLQALEEDRVLFFQLEHRLQEIGTEHRDPGHRIRVANIRERFQRHAREDHRMMVDAKKMVLVEGRVFDFWSDVSAERYVAAYNSLHAKGDAVILAEVIDDGSQGWDALKGIYASFHDEEVTDEQWQEYVAEVH